MIAPTSPAVTPSTRPPARRKQYHRPRFTPDEVAEIVRRYETESARALAAAYGCHRTTIEACVKRHGGGKLTTGKPRTPLSADEQAYITANFRGMTMAAIARHLHRSLKAVRTYAVSCGLSQPTKRVNPTGIVTDPAQYMAERTKRLAETRVEVLRLCDEAGVKVAGVPLSTLALGLVRSGRWRPATIHIAADLGDDGLFQPRPATEPCEALPGSLERVEAYARRVERGEEIWCGEDRTG